MIIGARRYAGPALNIGLRVAMVFFAVEAIVLSDDPRFQGKAIGIRNALVVAAYGLVFPALHLAGRRWRSGRRWSNHCRLTAAACARLGLESHLVLSGPHAGPSPNVTQGSRLATAPRRT